MRVYPWKQNENQGDRKMVMKVFTSSAVVFRIVGGLLSLGVASLTGLILVRRFANRNDSWIKRGALMSLGGILLFLILGGPAAWAGALNDALLSFGDKATTATFPSLVGFLIRSIAFGFFFQGFAVMMASYIYEVTGSRYLDRVKPTTKMKRRRKKNEAALIQNDKPEAESLAFGLIVDDPIPWRTARYGMICARPMDNIGHGVIVGGTGTGKTVTALSVAYQASVLDSAVFYIDFKASLRTLNSLKQAAAKAGKKFYSFDLGTGSMERSWYDPLDWRGSSSDKASMVVESLHFPEEGGASYYRGVANDWLIFQFDVIQEVGLFPGESSFDFLHETTNPAKMKERLAPLRKGDARQRSLYTSFTERADAGSMKDLAGLRQNLSLVVNAGGERLRPQPDAPAILMSRAVEEGAVVYFGLSPSTNLVALKTIGSLILKNLSVFAGERMREANLGSLRPILTLVDEASRLQDRANVLDDVLATAREAEIFLWMITQSFSTWPKSTIVEMTTNVWTYIAFRVQDAETAETLVSTLEDIPVLEEMTEDKVRHRAFQGDVKERSGDGRTTLTMGPFLSDAPMGIMSMDDLHAYIWFTGSWTRATIEKWSSKRLKKPDTIRNDAPLVRIVFMDYETEEEPIQGTSFSDLVTSADEITYNMENTTLRRTRRESLTDDDYSNIHLPGSPARGVAQWTDDADDSFGGFGPSQSGTVGASGRQVSDQDEPMWDESHGPQWDASPAPSRGMPAPAGEDITWESGPDDEDSDAPPVSHFYRPKPAPEANPSARPASAGSRGPETPGAGGSSDEFVSDSPAPQSANEFNTQEPASMGGDEDGLLWDSNPAPQTPPAQDATPVDEGFAPESAEWAEDTPAVQAAEGVRNTAPRQRATPAWQAQGPQKEGDVSQAPAYTGMPSHDTTPAPTEGTTSSADPASTEPSKRASRTRPGQGSTSTTASTPGTSAPAPSESETKETASTATDEGEGAEAGQGASNKGARGRNPQRKGPSKPKPKSSSKKNASDDWL